jgi:hypothetical protein
MKTSQVDVEFETVTVPCTAKNLRATFGWLLKEMRSVGKILRPDERDILRRIMNHKGEMLTVSALFLTFEREGEAHKTLRRLRATQFIYPANTGRWEADEPIEVTPFARLMWDHIGEERIFAPPAVFKPKEAVDVRTPLPSAQRAVTWDNLLECVRERQKANAAAEGRKS